MQRHAQLDEHGAVRAGEGELERCAQARTVAALPDHSAAFPMHFPKVSPISLL